MPDNFFIKSYKNNSSKKDNDSKENVKNDDGFPSYIFEKLSENVKETEKNKKDSPTNPTNNEEQNKDQKNIKKFDFKKGLASTPIETKKNGEKKTEEKKAKINNDSLISKKKLIALYLILSGIDKAKNVIKSLSQQELEKIIPEIIAIETITKDEEAEVEKNFGKTNISYKDAFGGREFARTLLQNTYGIAHGSEVFVRIIEDETKEKNFDFLNSIPDKNLRDILIEESDSVAALVLGMIDSLKAAKILEIFPKDRALNVIKTLSEKSTINKDVLNIVIKKMKESVSSVKKEDSIDIHGKDKLIEILKNSTTEISNNIINELQNDNPILATEIEENIFNFEDVVYLKPKDLEKILKNYPDKEIAFLLKGTRQEFKNLFFTCVSKRRKEIISEEINILGMVKKSEVEEKRKEFIKYLRSLEERGEISLKPDKDIYVS